MKLFLCWLVVAFAVLGASAHAGFASPSELRGPSSALSVDLYWTGLPRSSAPSALFAEADGRSSVSARGRRGLGYLREIRERLRHLFAVAFASFAIWTAGRSQGGGISATSPLQFRPPAAVASSDSGGNGHSLCYVGFSGLIHKDHLISLPGGEIVIGGPSFDTATELKKRTIAVAGTGAGLLVGPARAARAAWRRLAMIGAVRRRLAKLGAGATKAWLLASTADRSGGLEDSADDEGVERTGGEDEPRLYATMARKGAGERSILKGIAHEAIKKSKVAKKEEARVHLCLVKAEEDYFRIRKKARRAELLLILMRIKARKATETKVSIDMERVLAVDQVLRAGRMSRLKKETMEIEKQVEEKIKKEAHFT